MKKDEFLKHWRAIKPDQPIKPEVIPYKHAGSTYDCDGIRITGSRGFIDSVLSRLTDLLKFESLGTRLQVVYQESKDRRTGQPLASYNCYIQVHQRGGEGVMLQAFMASSRAKARGIDLNAIPDEQLADVASELLQERT